MVQTFTLRGINIGVPKSFANVAKDFGIVPQRLWYGKYYTILQESLLLIKAIKLHHDEVLSTS